MLKVALFSFLMASIVQIVLVYYEEKATFFLNSKESNFILFSSIKGLFMFSVKELNAKVEQQFDLKCKIHNVLSKSHAF